MYYVQRKGCLLATISFNMLDFDRFRFFSSYCIEKKLIYIYFTPETEHQLLLVYTVFLLACVTIIPDSV